MPTQTVVNLTSGTSWTVPAGVTYIIVRCYGGGGGGGTGPTTQGSNRSGSGGTEVVSRVITTPGASINYAIGAGGGVNIQGGTTTFTGATSSAGGAFVGGVGIETNNGGAIGGSGTAGKIDIEYWL